MTVVPYFLGVDLGTTYTAAAVARDGRAEPVELGDHSPQVPSVIWIGADGEFLVGDAAVRRGLSEPTRVAREFKRRMGDTTPMLLGGAPYPAHALTGKLLRWTVGEVVKNEGGPPDKIVISCPANWGPYFREMLDKAVGMAEVGPVDLCAEPVAAASHFASLNRVESGETLAIYDLGGGTFDAAVTRRLTHGFELLGSAGGIERLGGIDFDHAVFRHAVNAIGSGLSVASPEDSSAMAAMAQLRRECVDAKEALSRDNVVAISASLPGAPASIRLNRDEFEDMVRGPLRETVSSLRQTIDGSGVGLADIATIVLVGGSARIPLVKELLLEELGRPVALSPHPKLCVALGASLQPFGALTEAPVPAVSNPKLRPVTPAGSEQFGNRQEVETETPTAAPPPPSVITQHDEPKRKRRAAWASSYVRWAGAAAAVLILLALILARFGDSVTLNSALTYNGKVATFATGAPTSPPEEIRPTILNIPFLPPAELKDGTYDMGSGSFRLFIAGPVRTVDGQGESSQLLVNGQESLQDRMATIPGVACVLAFLFAFAYAEALLRPIRRRRRAKVGEVIGMIGVGVVTGVALAVAAWILRNQLLQAWVAVGIVLLMAVAAACLASAVAEYSRQRRRSTAGHE